MSSANHMKIRNLLLSHAKDLIQTFCDEGIHFSIACKTEMLNFNPPLTIDLQERIGEIAFFVLSGYSFQSLEIFEKCLVFEAGLTMANGEDIGTLITIPYSAIVQILSQEESMHQPIPIFINPFGEHQANDFNDSLNAILSKNLDLVQDQ